KKDGHIPRPPNQFMLFRAAAHDGEVSGLLPHGHSQRDFSRIVGERWRTMSKDEKAVWKQRQEEVKAAHLLQNPGYRYKPRQLK
ncbi:HMG-box, partial [Stereum hirsutum FP-91666 SS1]|uniref:HMG-box n=1 Tax=Stereum hirsutum (strain FP-91666) TaxID=721885 RepID=UPI00044494EC